MSVASLDRFGMNKIFVMVLINQTVQASGQFVSTIRKPDKMAAILFLPFENRTKLKPKLFKKPDFKSVRKMTI
jgi:hypothetical protein